MKRILLFAMVAFSLSFLLSSCMARRVVVTESDGTLKYHYWYYPTAQVYFDFERKIYYYPQDGGWHQSNQLPSSYSHDSSHVTVDSDSEMPYTDWEKHKMRYPREQRDENREKRHEDKRDDRDSNK